jgi:hypothetical protein
MSYRSLENTIRHTTRSKVEQQPVAKLQEEVDDEGNMAKGELRMIVSRAQELISMLDDNTQLEGWVQSKITKAEDYINSVYDYMKGQKGN